MGLHDVSFMGESARHGVQPVRVDLSDVRAGADAHTEKWNTEFFDLFEARAEMGVQCDPPETVAEMGVHCDPPEIGKKATEKKAKNRRRKRGMNSASSVVAPAADGGSLEPCAAVAFAVGGSRRADVECVQCSATASGWPVGRTTRRTAKVRRPVVCEVQGGPERVRDVSDDLAVCGGGGGLGGHTVVVPGPVALSTNRVSGFCCGGGGGLGGPTEVVPGPMDVSVSTMITDNGTKDALAQDSGGSRVSWADAFEGDGSTSSSAEEQPLRVEVVGEPGTPEFSGGGGQNRSNDANAATSACSSGAEEQEEFTPVRRRRRGRKAKANAPSSITCANPCVWRENALLA